MLRAEGEVGTVVATVTSVRDKRRRSFPRHRHRSRSPLENPHKTDGPKTDLKAPKTPNGSFRWVLATDPSHQRTERLGYEARPPRLHDNARLRLCASDAECSQGPGRPSGKRADQDVGPIVVAMRGERLRADSQHLIQTPDTLVLRVLGEIIRSIEAEFEEEEKQYRGVKYSQMRR